VKNCLDSRPEGLGSGGGRKEQGKGVRGGVGGGGTPPQASIPSEAVEPGAFTHTHTHTHTHTCTHTHTHTHVQHSRTCVGMGGRSCNEYKDDFIVPGFSKIDSAKKTYSAY